MKRLRTFVLRITNYFDFATTKNYLAKKYNLRYFNFEHRVATFTVAY